MRADPPRRDGLDDGGDADHDGPDLDPDDPVHWAPSDPRHPALHWDEGPPVGPDGPPARGRTWRELVPVWLGGLTLLGLAVLAVTLLRSWTDAEWFDDLTAVALPSFVTAGVGALLWETWKWHRAGTVRVPPPAAAAAPVAGWPADALRRAHRRGRRGVLQRALPWVVLVLLAVAAVVGHRASERDAWLLRTQPVIEATVVEVRPPLLGRGDPAVVVELDGRRAELVLSYPESDDAAPGVAVQVVVDPDDPAHVLATTSHDDWAYTWWAEVLLWALLVPVCVVPARWRMPRRGAVRAARAARDHRPARVVAVGDGWAALDVDGDRWVFTGQTPAGEQVVLMGEPRAGAWVVLDDGRTRLPDGPLRSSTFTDDEWDDEEDGPA